MKSNNRYNQYDSSLKVYVSASGDTSIARAYGVKKSTYYNWKNADYTQIIGRNENLNTHEDYELFKKFIKDQKVKVIYKHYRNISEHFLKLLDKIPSPQKFIQKNKHIVINAISNFKDSLGIEKTLKLFKVSYQQYIVWIKDRMCPISLENKCKKKYPNQLLDEEVRTIKYLLLSDKFKYWSKNSIYFYGLRNKLLSCCLTSFYKYSNFLGIQREKPKHRRKNHTIGIRALFPNQIWHADVTPFRTGDNSLIYIYLVVDNYSRYILSWDMSRFLSAKIRMKTFKEAYRNFGHLKPRTFIDLIVDGGPENKKEVDIFINSPEIFIRKLIAMKDIRFSNAMVEASNKMLKYHYLFRKDIYNEQELRKHLNFSINDHNLVKPYGPLKGLIPVEGLVGKIPDYSIFKDQIQEAIQKRVKFNQT